MRTLQADRAADDIAFPGGETVVRFPRRFTRGMRDGRDQRAFEWLVRCASYPGLDLHGETTYVL